MSSLIRRIQRQVHPSHPQPRIALDGTLSWETSPPRKVFYLGRGSKLGVRNPKAKDLLARQRREARRKSKT